MKRQAIPKSKLCSPWPIQKRKANREAIEWDLKTYKAMKKEIDDILQEIDDMAAPTATDVRSSIYSIPHKSTFKPRQLGDQPEYIASHPTRNEGDPTASKAEEIRRYRELKLSGTEYREMVRRINAIERVMERLERSKVPDDILKAKLIRMKYFDQDDTDKGIRAKLDISERTFYRWQIFVIKRVAKELGFVI
jgi:hypothetical protein